MPENAPLTIATMLNNTEPLDGGPQITVGTATKTIPWNLNNAYWAVVVDRTNLNIVQSFTFSNNQLVPDQLTPYLNNPQYLLILTTQAVNSRMFPAGQFYDFLVEIGANGELKSMEQIGSTLNCGYAFNLSYTIVAVMDGSAKIEYSFYNYYELYKVYTLQLVPVTDSDGNTLYTPAAL